MGPVTVSLLLRETFTRESLSQVLSADPRFRLATASSTGDGGPPAAVTVYDHPADLPVAPARHGSRTLLLGVEGTHRCAEMVPRSQGLAGLVAALLRADDAEDRVGPDGAGAKVLADGPMRLTPRETEVLRALATTSTAAEAAASLSLSAKTIDNHKRRIFAKLAANSVAHAISLAHVHGLLTLATDTGDRR